MAKYLIKTLPDSRIVFSLEDDGKVMLTSKPYLTKRSCMEGLHLARISCKHYFSYKRNLSPDLRFYFLLRLVNGEILAKSDFFESAMGMEVGIEWVRKFGETSAVEELVVN